MRACILPLCLTFLIPLVVSAQTASGRKPVLTGSLISVSAKVNRNGPKPLMVYELRLNLQLRNDTNEPLILVKPWMDLVSRRIELVDGYGDGVRPLPWIIPVKEQLERTRESLRSLPPPRNKYDPWEDLAKALDRPDPRYTVALILEPGAIYEFGELLTIEDGYKLEINPGQSLTEVATNYPIALFPSFRIEYTMSLKKHHPNDGLLRVLQERWKPFGHLVLDDAGDFRLRSDLMFNREGH